MHGLEDVVDIVDEDVCIDFDERVVHPCLVQLLPVCSSDPQVLEGFKLFSQPTQLVITAKKYSLRIEKNLLDLDLISPAFNKSTFVMYSIAMV